MIRGLAPRGAAHRASASSNAARAVERLAAARAHLSIAELLFMGGDASDADLERDAAACAREFAETFARLAAGDREIAARIDALCSIGAA